jgi:hypothetical protein
MVALTTAIAGVNAASGLFSAAKGLFGGNKGPKFQTVLNDSLTAQRKQANRYWGDIMYNSKKHNLHPAMMLGQQTHGQSFPISYDQGNNQTWSESVGTGIQRATEAVMTERERLKNKLLKSQIDGQEISNAKAASDAAIATAGAPPAVSEALPSETISSSVDSEGVEAAHTPLFKKFKIGGGKHIYGLSPAGSESIEGFGHIGGTALGGLALLGSAPLYARDIGRSVKRDWKKAWSKNKHKWSWKYLKDKENWKNHFRKMKGG